MSVLRHHIRFFFFFFNDTATTEIYTLSLHDALPICSWRSWAARTRSRAAASSFGASPGGSGWRATRRPPRSWSASDRKSTRLNSSHSQISYAVFCLKKKKTEHSDKVSDDVTIYMRIY